jgi:hypothetical protein
MAWFEPGAHGAVGVDGLPDLRVLCFFFLFSFLALVARVRIPGVHNPLAATEIRPSADGPSRVEMMYP